MPSFLYKPVSEILWFLIDLLGSRKNKLAMLETFNEILAINESQGHKNRPLVEATRNKIERSLETN